MKEWLDNPVVRENHRASSQNRSCVELGSASHQEGMKESRSRKFGCKESLEPSVQPETGTVPSGILSL